jgi:F0F1-type ATP synthase assembly protein I
MTDELKKLQENIKKVKSDNKVFEDIPSTRDAAQDAEDKKSIRIATDLIGTPIVCGAIGMAIDSWANTKPVFFIILAFLGVLAGFWNVYKAGNK